MLTVEDQRRHQFAAHKLGFTLKKFPIMFEDRKYGESKMNHGIVKKGIIGVLKLRWYSFLQVTEEE